MDILSNRIFLFATVGLLTLTGCQITYYTKSAYNHLNILGQRQSFESALKRPDLSEQERAKLNLIKETRAFMDTQLGIDSKKNYTHYVHLDKKFPVWAVNAAPKWKLEHHMWNFLFVGDVPYKGFPTQDAAEAEANQLQKQDFDTFVRGVSAYSTLGWLSDPILSSMLRYSDHDLVNTIIHETTHTILYIKSSADFNERLASFVGNKGTELFYLSREGKNSQSLQKIKDEHDDDFLFSKFISQELKILEQKYLSLPKEKRNDSQRREWFQQIKANFIRDIKPQLKTKNYHNFLTIPLNNARLLLYRTYTEDLSDFEALWQKSGSDMKIFLQQAKSLEKSKDPIASLKDLIVGSQEHGN